MKNLNLIGAVMMVSLSFTACQKDDVLAPRPSATGQTARMNNPEIIAKQFPARVMDLLTGKDKTFFYDDSKRLVMVKEGGKNMEFSYDNSGRVTKIAITSLRESRDASKVLALQYAGDAEKPSRIDEQSAAGSNMDAFVKTTLIKYDSQMNKISEQEIGADHSMSVTRLYTNDSRGNCIEFKELHNGIVAKHLKFADFDLRPSLAANIKVLALLPGAIFQKSNAQTVSEILSVRKADLDQIEDVSDIQIISTQKLINNGVKPEIGVNTVHYKFLYNSFGFPTDVIQVLADSQQTIQTIEYMTNQW